MRTFMGKVTMLAENRRSSSLLHPVVWAILSCVSRAATFCSWFWTGGNTVAACWW